MCIDDIFVPEDSNGNRDKTIEEVNAMEQKNILKMSLLLVLLTATFYPAYAQKKLDAVEKAVADSAASVNDPLAFERSVLEYESRGNRDPFESLAPDDKGEGEDKLKGLFNYEGSILRGIVSTDNDIYALVSDQDNYSYVLRKGYRVFGGYVTDITEEAVHFHIVKYGRSLSIRMRLASSKSTVFDEHENGSSLIQKPGIKVEYMKSDSPVSDEPVIRIEDVIVPSLETKTVEEVWFGVDNESPPVPEKSADTGHDIAFFTLFDPPNGSDITIPYVLNWTSLEGSGVRYSLIIDDNADFSSPIFVEENIQVSSCVIGDQIEFPTGVKLYWKVNAIDSAGAKVECRSTNMSFTIR